MPEKVTFEYHEGAGIAQIPGSIVKLQVAPNKYVRFIGGRYSTDNEDEIAALDSAVRVTRVESAADGDKPKRGKKG